jgi:hypothetical protein
LKKSGNPANETFCLDAITIKMETSVAASNYLALLHSKLNNDLLSTARPKYTKLFFVGKQNAQL